MVHDDHNSFLEPLMMILEQYGALLIASPCESGIKSSFYGTFNKLQ